MDECLHFTFNFLFSLLQWQRPCFIFFFLVFFPTTIPHVVTGFKVFGLWSSRFYSVNIWFLILKFHLKENHNKNCVTVSSLLKLIEKTKKKHLIVVNCYIVRLLPWRNSFYHFFPFIERSQFSHISHIWFKKNDFTFHISLPVTIFVLFIYSFFRCENSFYEPSEKLIQAQDIHMDIPTYRLM